MGIYTDAIQKLYVAYFSRPADVAGLAYWENVVAANKGSTTAVSAAFAASAEYKAAFAGLDAYHIVDQVYVNLFGRHAEPAGLNYWGQLLLNNKLTVDAIVTAVAGGAQGTDAVAYSSKVAGATAFTAALDTSAEILGYANPASNAGAANFIAGITDAATLAAAVTPATLDATILAITTPQPIGTTYALTSGVDTLTGTNANDTFNASAGQLSTFDSINGSAGNDVLNIVDAVLGGPLLNVNGTAAAISGIETVQIRTVNQLTVDTTAMSGVTKLTASSDSAAALSATAAGTTDVTIASKAAAGAAITVAGGKAVTVTASDATAGNVSVTGAALTAVVVNGGANVVVDNGAKGTTLTQASVFGATGSTISLTGAALTNVSLSNLVQAEAVTVSNATAGHALNLSLSSVGYDTAATPAAVAMSVTDNAATSFNVNTVTKSNVSIAGTKLATANLTGAGALVLSGAGAAAMTTVNGAAATGALTLNGLTSKVNTVTTGTGNDKVAFSAATVLDTTNATVSTGAGNDTITLTTTGDGVVTVSAGDGDDTVILTSRGTADVMNIDLGAGTDTLSAAVAIVAGDTVNGGAGSDTLALNLVGSANIGAFAGFELFDAVALNKALDVDILASKNTVTEVIASGNVGAATLTNVGAGVGVRATGDMGASTLIVTQKVAGAITVTADMDEKGAGDDLADARTASINVGAATSANIVFGTDYVASTAAEKLLAVDNTTTLNFTATGVTAATVAAGGSLSNDVLVYNDVAGGKLASLTVTGAQSLNVTVNNAVKLTNVDATAHTGGLTISTNSIADGGVIKFGSGVDKVTVGSNSNVVLSVVPVAGDLHVEQISGLEKTLSISVTADPADAAAVAAATAAIADADTFNFGMAANVASASTVVGGAVTAKGVLTFSGAGPSTLADAFAIANLAAETNGEVLVFTYLTDSYVFMQNGATDLSVKLVGVTGITNVAEVGATDAFFIV